MDSGREASLLLSRLHVLPVTLGRQVRAPGTRRNGHKDDQASDSRHLARSGTPELGEEPPGVHQAGGLEGSRWPG